MDRKALAIVLAIALAMPAEGLRQYAYRDPVGILTTCYGHTGADVVKNRKYSLAECEGLLTQDMKQAVDQVEACHPGLPEQVLAAFSDATFNIGPKVACDSTASRLLAAGRIEDACRQLPKWNKARVGGTLVELPGLTKRRLKEMELCLEGAK